MRKSAYPLVLTKLAQYRCIVVGGGAVAERKIADLLAGGARPQVISPVLTERLNVWRDEGRIEHLARSFEPGDVTGARLVIAATDDRAVNRLVASEAEATGALLNVVDDPERGNFHTVASVRRGDLLLTVSTGGASPALAAGLRLELEARYGPEYERLLELFGELRDDPAGAQARRCLWQRLVSEDVLARLRAGEDVKSLLATFKN